MPLDRKNWPTLDQIKIDLSARFRLPALPAKLHDWFAFAHGALDMDIFLDTEHSEALGYGAMPLDGLAVMDSSSALAAMNGYRFVLDQRRSSPDALIWADQTTIGEWQPHWFVIESIQADPFIADISRPEVPVLFARHGSDCWSPAQIFERLDDFIASLRVEPRQTTAFEPSPFYTVTIEDFGADPKKALLALKKMPAYRGYAPAALLALTKQTPLVVLEENASAWMAEKYAQMFRECGATALTISKFLG